MFEESSRRRFPRKVSWELDIKRHCRPFRGWVCSKGPGEPWQSFEEGRITVIYKKDPFVSDLYNRLESARVEVWSPGGGQGRNSSGRTQAGPGQAGGEERRRWVRETGT